MMVSFTMAIDVSSSNSQALDRVGYSEVRDGYLKTSSNMGINSSLPKALR